MTFGHGFIVAKMNNREPKIRRPTDVSPVIKLVRRLNALEETVRKHEAELTRLKCNPVLVDVNPPETGSTIELKRR